MALVAFSTATSRSSGVMLASLRAMESLVVVDVAVAWAREITENGLLVCETALKHKYGGKSAMEKKKANMGCWSFILMYENDGLYYYSWE